MLDVTTRAGLSEFQLRLVIGAGLFCSRVSPELPPGEDAGVVPGEAEGVVVGSALV
jgi:hypothetical protein